ncbi:hypothetical protein D3C86_1762160 [compost metagenome]
MQSRTGTGYQVLPRRLIGRGQPAFRVIDDADCRVTITDNKYQAANGLIAVGGGIRQQFRRWKCQRQMNQDRRTLGQDAAVGQLQRRNLLERIEFHQRLRSLRRRLDINETIRNLTQLQRGLDRRRARVLVTIELIHTHLLGMLSSS